MAKKHLPPQKESVKVGARTRAAVAVAVAAMENSSIMGMYRVGCVGPREEVRDNYVRMRDKLLASPSGYGELIAVPSAERTEILALPLGKAVAEYGFTEDELLTAWDMRDLEEQKWPEEALNVVTTVGKNDILDKYWGGSGYTAAPFVGLISSVSYSAVAAADTMSSHAGWTEAGPTNAPNYSQGTRPALTFGAASAGSKATSSPSAFSITGAGTLKGCFATTVSTKDGTTGILISAGLFTGGDRVVANGDTVNVSYTSTLT